MPANAVDRPRDAPNEATATPVSERPPSSEHVPALDGVRGVAILAVLLVHSCWQSTQTLLDRALTAVLNCGWMGVDLFFVLSGFLITGILLDSRHAPTYYRAFYARRALRILPLYYAFVGFFVVVLPHFHRSTPELHDLLVHQGWLWAHAVNLWAARDGLASIPYSIGVAWSLSLEEQFYLLWPLVVRVARPRALPWICVACILGALLLRMAIATHSPSAAYTLMPARMDALALGGLVACVQRMPGGMERLRKIGLPIAATALTAVVAMYVALGTMRGQGWTLSTFGYAGADWLAVGVVLLALTRSPAVLSSRPLRFFGRYSYAMYLVHLPVITVLAPIEARLLAGAPVWGSRVPWMGAWMLLVVATTTLLALISWTCVEEPFLQLKRYFPYGTPHADSVAREGAPARPAALAFGGATATAPPPAATRP